jgi:DNA-binding response OmpR family regulator
MSGTVLIVDDSLTVRMDLLEQLAAAGMTAVACGTVAEARQAMAGNQFSLVILDVLLPDGDGIELLEEIRAESSPGNMAVMLLSTESEIRDRIRGLTRGADDYVGKPYDPNYVIARARELVRRGDVIAPKGQDIVKETVLLIDDSITFREELRAVLEQASYRVVVAGTGEEGLRLAIDLRPTAIIVDGVLPGIDGAAVIRRIRFDAALRRVPCLLLTASEDRGAEVRALDAGADAFVRKEEDITVVLAKLNAVLRSAGTQITDRARASLLAPKRILAVDDSETSLRELADLLRADGYEVVLARSGEEALQLLSVQPVDCILLDLIMPGIGGKETCRRMKNIAVVRDIPVIILTAVDDRDSMIQGLAAGADDYIAKSSDFDLLRARVLAQIRRKQFEDENRLIREQLLRAELEAMEAQTARKIAEARAALVEELEMKNRELEAFSYSVAHDLRAPLRSIDGFSQALLEDCGDKLDDEGKQHLRYVRESAQGMAVLIDGMLSLSRVARSELRSEPVDLSDLAQAIFAQLRKSAPNRSISTIAAEDLVVEGDPRLLRVMLENLLGNAWKFTTKCAAPKIEFGTVANSTPRTYFVRDNGAGFDMSYVGKLFGVFQRLHSTSEFEGTGIGLATVQRIVSRHGGRVWAESEVDRGAAFYFTLWATRTDFKAA